ncbi:uncharacterized protein BYT42DRAFT_544214 [Radiomyces spectabilis]|uniref:uncharacterized protein n=1 Tax=Radiomyces spectabilis TaxID=64574 RepID=UPI00221EDD98|nr:uncharacterized protein BYT42DRAFT_544214 [Radiomyces spectabilis]KAI8384294.1 hypothetical protein BYT42DRAFT_544214 [Radiomyces spectabilis]
MANEKLSLTVSVGDSIDSLQPVTFNDDAHPVHIKNSAFEGDVAIRIRGRPGNTHYFDHSDDTFCIQIRGRFLHEHLTADDILFGNQFDRPIRLPTGSSVALKFAQWFDPGLQADLYSDQPHAFSPLIVTMNRLAVTQSKDMLAFPSDGAPVEEDVTMLSFDLKSPKDRKTFYTSAQNRKAVQISDDQVWCMDFGNPYLDFAKCTVRLPGFEVDALRYWDGQPVRYVAKTKDDSMVFFVIEFNLQEGSKGINTEDQTAKTEDKNEDTDID